MFTDVVNCESASLFLLDPTAGGSGLYTVTGTNYDNILIAPKDGVIGITSSTTNSLNSIKFNPKKSTSDLSRCVFVKVFFCLKNSNLLIFTYIPQIFSILIGGWVNGLNLFYVFQYLIVKTKL